MIKKKRNLFFIILGLLFVAFILFLWRASVFRISKNFEEVDPGKFYRSAQLTAEELEELVLKYGIKTVVSLRGAPENSYWVPGQVEVLKKHNVNFVPVWWTIDFAAEKNEMLRYLKTLQEGPYPILVHCRTGADRTGEATAIYAVDKMGQSKEQAISNHLAFNHWHVQTFHPAKSEMIRRWKGMDWELANYDHCGPELRDLAEPGHCL